MKKFRKCAASRYCRLHTAIKTSAVVLLSTVVSIVLLFEGKF